MTDANEIILVSRIIGGLAMLLGVIMFFYMLRKNKIKGYLKGYSDAKDNKKPEYSVTDL